MYFSNFKSIEGNSEKIDYKRVLSPIKRNRNIDVGTKDIENTINEMKKEICYELPQSYIEMLKACDGGRLKKADSLKVSNRIIKKRGGDIIEHSYR